MPISSYYSIVQWCPDAARMETVNIGLVMVGPTRTKALIQTEIAPERIRTCLGRHVDAAYLSAAISSFENRFRNELTDVYTSEAVDQWAGRLGNDIVMTPCRGVAIEGDRTECFNEMFRRLVQRPLLKPAIERSRLSAQLSALMRREDLSKRVEREKKILVPTLGSVTAPYAYGDKNLTLVKPIHMGTRAEDDARYWRLIAELVDSAKVEILLASPFSDAQKRRREACESILAGSKATWYGEEGFDQFEGRLSNTRKNP